MPLSHLFTHNRRWKLISLLIAVGIWYFVHDTTQSPVAPGALTITHLRTFTRPITVMAVAAESRSFSVRPESVEVTVRGRPEDIENLKPSDVEVAVNLIDVTEARGLRKRIQVTTPPGIEFVDSDPEEVVVESHAADRPSIPLP